MADGRDAIMPLRGATYPTQQIPLSPSNRRLCNRQPAVIFGKTADTGSNVGADSRPGCECPGRVQRLVRLGACSLLPASHLVACRRHGNFEILEGATWLLRRARVSARRPGVHLHAENVCAAWRCGDLPFTRIFFWGTEMENRSKRLLQLLPSSSRTPVMHHDRACAQSDTLCRLCADR